MEILAAILWALIGNRTMILAFGLLATGVIWLTEKAKLLLCKGLRDVGYTQGAYRIEARNLGQ